MFFHFSLSALMAAVSSFVLVSYVVDRCMYIIHPWTVDKLRDGEHAPLYYSYATAVVLRTINMYHTYTIRRESTREELKSSRRDEKCKARTAVGRGEEESATYVTPDLSYD